MVTRYISLCLLLAGVRSLPAQPLAADTSFLAAAKMKQIQRYTTDIGGQARLYNGSAYKDFFSRDDEHPYFGIDDWVYGDIVYDEALYVNVPMFYDISSDKVITEHMLSGSKLELVNAKVMRFSLGKHQFIRVPPGETDQVEGFVEVLYDGKTKVYARREKILMEKIESNSIIPRFDHKTRLYNKSGDRYYPVKSKRSVFGVLDDHRQELKAFLGKQKIRYGTDREYAIVLLATQYDTLDN
jgi:hypothetical protein